MRGVTDKGRLLVYLSNELSNSLNGSIVQEQHITEEKQGKTMNHIEILKRIKKRLLARRRVLEKEWGQISIPTSSYSYFFLCPPLLHSFYIL